MNHLRFDEVHLTAALGDDRQDGLIGWIRCTVNGAIRLDGITLRRTVDGRLTLSFPARKDRRGVLHPIVQPLDEAIRRWIEVEILEQLGFTEGSW